MSSANPSNPLLEIILARLREFWREPAAIFWVYGFPLIMAVALGLAFRNRPVAQEVKVDIGQGNVEWVQQVRDALAQDERFTIEISEEVDWRSRLRTGDTDLVVLDSSISLPEGLEELPPSASDEDSSPDDQSAGQVSEMAESLPKYRFVFDPTRPGSLLARDAVNEALQRANGRTDRVTIAEVEFSEPGGRYIDFLIPGLLGMSLMGGGLWGVGFAIVDLRIRKLLKRFVATPMKRWHFLAGIMISRMLFMIPEMILLIIFARIFFGVQVHGNIGEVCLLILLGAVQFSGIGLLIACRASTLESVSGLMNLTMLPMWIASGIFFKSSNFPDFLQPAINLLPLTPLIRALRSVMLEGTSLLELGPDLVAIVVWSVVTFVLALMFFRWN